MKHILLIILVSTMTSVAEAIETDAVSVKDTISVKELQEVTVKGDRILHKAGYQVLLLDSRNRNFGTNALDAVSSLSMFQTNINDDKLLSSDHSNVFILINGIPSTAMDLRSYKGSDIKNVEFYPSAPAQYMAFTDGPLVNVVLKKRHDRLYTGYINTINAVTTGFGTNQFDFSYSDSLNQVKAGYLLDYRDIGDISTRSRYNLEGEWSSTTVNRKRYAGQYHSAYGSYQHYRTNHLFNARLSFVTQPLNETSDGEMQYTEGPQPDKSPLSSMLKTNAKTAAIDLYYYHRLANGSNFVVNIVNTFGRSHAGSAISSPLNGEVESMTRSRSYSLIANTFFSSRMLGGNCTVGTRYEYKQLNQEYSGQKARPSSHNEFLSLGYSRSIGEYISLVPSVGLMIISQSDGSLSRTGAHPYVRLYTDWWPGGKLKGFTTQLTLLTRHMSTALSMLTNSCSYKDYHYLTAGNPDLKNYWENWGKLSLSYFVPGRRDKVTVMGQSRILRNPIASKLEVIGLDIYLRPVNFGHYSRHRFDLFGSWYPVEWLEISPYVEYYIYRFDASSRRRESYLRYGGSVTATLGNFILMLAANSPTRDFDGDLTVVVSVQYAAKIQYRCRNWSFGAEYHYSGHHERTRGSAGDASVWEDSDWRQLHKNVALTATYSFSIGRSRRHSSKMVNESSDDNGINKYNRPSMPK